MNSCVLSTVRTYKTCFYFLGTSPHIVSSVSVTTEMNQANVSWVPGFDGGYTQKFTVWWGTYNTISIVQFLAASKFYLGLDFGCCDISFRVKHASRGKHEWASLPVPTSKNYLLVTGLLAGTDYQFSVLPQNRLGSGPFSEIVSVRTQGLCKLTYDLYSLSPHSLWCCFASMCQCELISGLLISCADRSIYSCQHPPNAGSSHIPVSQPDWTRCSPPVVASRGSNLSTDGLCAAGPQESGPVGHPQQHHQCQPEWTTCTRTAKGNRLLVSYFESVCSVLSQPACISMRELFCQKLSHIKPVLWFILKM